MLSVNKEPEQPFAESLIPTQRNAAPKVFWNLKFRFSRLNLTQKLASGSTRTNFTVLLIIFYQESIILVSDVILAGSKDKSKSPVKKAGKQNLYQLCWTKIRYSPSITRFITIVCAIKQATSEFWKTKTLWTQKKASTSGEQIPAPEIRFKESYLEKNALHLWETRMSIAHIGTEQDANEPEIRTDQKSNRSIN